MKFRGWMAVIGAGWCLSAAAIRAQPPADPALEALLTAAGAEERRVEESGRLLHDPDLEAYLNRVASALARGEKGPGAGFRVRVIRDPHLNAFTYPTGTFLVHTGILARIENEAQLAALLGHELAPYLKGHAIEGMRCFHRGAGGQNPESEAGCASPGYRREAEYEADREGLQRLLAAGYDPAEALRLFEHLAEEAARENLREPFLEGSHPRLQDRIERAQAVLDSLEKRETPASRNEDAFGEAVSGAVLENIRLDLRAGRFPQARAAAEKWTARRPENARIHFLLGEIHRQTGSQGGGGTGLAESCYRRAITLDGAYAEPHRALGWMYVKQGRPERAREHLEACLSLAPEAPENAFVRHYLGRPRP